MIYYFVNHNFFFGKGGLGAPLRYLISRMIYLLFQVGCLMLNPPRNELTRV